jgi:hypothetical protein
MLLVFIPDFKVGRKGKRKVTLIEKKMENKNINFSLSLFPLLFFSFLYFSFFFSFFVLFNVYDKRKSQTSESHKKSYLDNKIQDIIPKTNPNH